MKKKLFSIFISIVLIISLCVVSSSPASSLFIADDLIYSIGISIAASVLLSLGISAVSQSDNVYVESCKAVAALTFEQMLQDYTQAQIASMIIIENGKAYFQCSSSLFNRLRNWVSQYNWSTVSTQSNITSSNTDFVGASTSYHLPQYEGYYSIQESSKPMSLTVFHTTAYYTPSRGCIINLNNDNTVIVFHPDIDNFNQSNYVAMIGLCSDGNFRIGNVWNDYGYNPPNVNNATMLRNTRGFSIITSIDEPNAYALINGNRSTIRFNNNNQVLVNDNVIANLGSVSREKYLQACIISGQILSNTNNNQVNVNTNSNFTTYETAVDTESVPTSIPGNGQIGSNQTALVPLPANLIEPETGIILTNRQVKSRIKDGLPIGIEPDLLQLKDETGATIGTQIVNTVTDTPSGVLETTIVNGENSSTYVAVVVPGQTGVVDIPSDENYPIVTSPYPDVINPGNETITVTANNDVFPTASAVTPETVVPTDNAEIASSAVERVSDIAKDIVTPLTPEDVEKGAERMKLMPQLQRKFPFCIPFDFYTAVNQIKAPSEVPSIDVPFHIQSINFDYTFHFDLEQWEQPVKVIKWFFAVGWVVGLMLLTRKVVWK